MTDSEIAKKEHNIIIRIVTYSVSVVLLLLIGSFFVVDYYSLEVGFLFVVIGSLGFYKLGHKLNILSPKDN